jgi:hypothetical protein
VAFSSSKKFGRGGGLKESRNKAIAAVAAVTALKVQKGE